MAKKKTKPKADVKAAPPRLTASEENDLKLARQALEKKRRGEKIPREEAAALRRVEKAEEEKTFWDVVQNRCTKKRYLEMAGRQARTVNEQADRYNLPISGPTIDIAKLVSRLHQFLADNSGVLSSDDALLGGPQTESLERLRVAQAIKVELQNSQTKGELRPADDVHKCYQLIASVFRRASAELRKKYGDEACELLAQAVHTADDILAGFLRNDHSREEFTDTE